MAELTARQQYDELNVVEDDPLERLRLFCSIAMNGQDWLDVEPFFDALRGLDAQRVDGYVPGMLTKLEQCDRHKGMPIKFKASLPTLARVVCPNCEEEEGNKPVVAAPASDPVVPTAVAGQTNETSCIGLAQLMSHSTDDDKRRLAREVLRFDSRLRRAVEIALEEATRACESEQMRIASEESWNLPRGQIADRTRSTVAASCASFIRSLSPDDIIDRLKKE